LRSVLKRQAMTTSLEGRLFLALLPLPLLAACATSVVAVPSTANHAYVVTESVLTSSMFHCVVENGQPLCVRVQEKGGGK
jgi:hypothetical protein